MADFEKFRGNLISRMADYENFRGNLISRMADFENFRGNLISRILAKTAKSAKFFFPRKFLPLRYDNLSRVSQIRSHVTLYNLVGQLHSHLVSQLFINFRFFFIFTSLSSFLFSYFVGPLTF